MINTETVLFINCEMLVNTVLCCLFISFFVLFNAHNFRNIFFYYPSVFRRDLLMSQSLLLFIYRRSNMLVHKNRLIYIHLIKVIYNFVYKSVLSLNSILHNMLLLQLYHYIESNLLFIFFYYSPITQFLNTLMSLIAYLCVGVMSVVYTFKF